MSDTGKIITRKEIYRQLSERCLTENAAVSAKIQAIIRNPVVSSWVAEMPIIPDLMLTLLGAFENLDKLVTKDFVWEYWSRSLVEDEYEAPDVTLIADMDDMARYVEYMGGYDPQYFPIKSSDDLRRDVVKCRSQIRRRFL